MYDLDSSGALTIFLLVCRKSGGKGTRMMKFKAAQAAFLREDGVCRLATASAKGLPHVTPVIYALGETRSS